MSLYLKKRQAQSKSIGRSHTLHLLLLALLTTAIIALSWKIILSSPPLFLLLLTPALVGIAYRYYHWWIRHPYVISDALAGAIGTFFRALTRTHRRRRTRTRSENAKKKIKEAAELPKPYPYVKHLRDYLALILHTDTWRWTIAHHGLLTLAALIALNMPQTLPAAAYFLIAYAPVIVTSWRYQQIRRLRDSHRKVFYGFFYDKFGYSTALSKSKMSDKDKFGDYRKVINVTWQQLTEPEDLEVIYPAEWSDSDMRVREKIESAFELRFPSPTVRKFIWSTGDTKVLITPANYPENVLWDGYTSGEWHRFAVGKKLDNGELLFFSVVNNAPHILIAGETGSGKSETMFSIAAQTALLGWTIRICDPKGAGWLRWTKNFRYTDIDGPFTGAAPLEPGDARPGVIEHATELYGIYDVVKRTYEELTRRKLVQQKYGIQNFDELDEQTQKAEGVEPTMLIIDEALSLFAVDKGSSEDIVARNQLRQEILSMVLRLIVEARAYRIHLMLGFQRPDTKYMDGSARDNTGIRIALSYLSLKGREMMFGDISTVPALPLIKNNKPDEVVKGRGQARMGSGQPVHNFQSFWCGKGASDLDKYLPLPAGERNHTPQMVDTEVPEGTQIMVPVEREDGTGFDIVLQDIDEAVDSFDDIVKGSWGQDSEPQWGQVPPSAAEPAGEEPAGTGQEPTGWQPPAQGFIAPDDDPFGEPVYRPGLTDADPFPAPEEPAQVQPPAPAGGLSAPVSPRQGVTPKTRAKKKTAAQLQAEMEQEKNMVVGKGGRDYRVEFSAPVYWEEEGEREILEDIVATEDDFDNFDDFEDSFSEQLLLEELDSPHNGSANAEDSQETGEWF